MSTLVPGHSSTFAMPRARSDLPHERRGLYAPG
jgi:hypothetical protein